MYKRILAWISALTILFATVVSISPAQATVQQAPKQAVLYVNATTVIVGSNRYVYPTFAIEGNGASYNQSMIGHISVEWLPAGSNPIDANLTRSVCGDASTLVGEPGISNKSCTTYHDYPYFLLLGFVWDTSGCACTTLNVYQNPYPANSYGRLYAGVNSSGKTYQVRITLFQNSVPTHVGTSSTYTLP